MLSFNPATPVKSRPLHPHFQVRTQVYRRRNGAHLGPSPARGHPAGPKRRGWVARELLAEHPSCGHRRHGKVKRADLLQVFGGSGSRLQGLLVPVPGAVIRTGVSAEPLRGPAVMLLFPLGGAKRRHGTPLCRWQHTARSSGRWHPQVGIKEKRATSLPSSITESADF